MNRWGTAERTTAETSISVRVELDGTGQVEVDTPIGFLDHLLVLFGRHALVDLEVRATGDVHIDEHHTVEDTALVLGRAIDSALGERAGIRRYGDI
nr:imidazoleglycerol-phosphate dehydratase [Chloroflexota bacterium]